MRITLASWLRRVKDDLISKLGGFVTFGGNIMQQKRTKMNASAGTLLVPDLFDVNNGVDKPSITSSLTQRKMNSLYGSLQLNWDGWLFLDVTARNDWSSTMSKRIVLISILLLAYLL